MSSIAITGWTLRTLNFLLPRRPTMDQRSVQQSFYYCLVTRSQTLRIALRLSESALLSLSLFPHFPARWTYYTCPWDLKTFSHKKAMKVSLALVFLYCSYFTWLLTAPIWCSECPDDHTYCLPLPPYHLPLSFWLYPYHHHHHYPYHLSSSTF